LPHVNGSDGALILLGALVIVCLGAYYVSLGKEKPFKGLPASGLTLRQSLIPRPSSAQGARRVARNVAGAAPARVVRQPLPMEHPALEHPGSPQAGTLLQEAEALIDGKSYDSALASYRQALDWSAQDE